MTWEHLAFADAVRSRGSGASGLPQSEWQKMGRFPVIGQGSDFIEGWTDREDLVLTPEPAVVLYGGHTRRAKYVDRPFVPGPNVKILEPIAKLDSKFLFHYLAQLNIKSRGYADHFPEVRRCSVPVPPFPEQLRIAAILDSVDALRAKRQEAIDKLDQLLRSVFLNMFGDPVVNPKKWPICAVGDVTSCIVPGRDKPKSFTGATPWVTTEDLAPLSTTTKSKKGLGLTGRECELVRAKVVPKDSVLISCVGDLGVVSLAGVDLVVNQQLHSFQCGDEVLPYFLMHCLSYQRGHMSSRASSTTIPYMNKAVCNGIPVFVPPLEIQKKFSDFCLAFENESSIVRASAETLDDLRAAMVQQVFWVRQV